MTRGIAVSRITSASLPPRRGEWTRARKQFIQTELIARGVHCIRGFRLIFADTVLLRLGRGPGLLSIARLADDMYALTDTHARSRSYGNISNGPDFRSILVRVAGARRSFHCVSPKFDDEDPLRLREGEIRSFSESRKLPGLPERRFSQFPDEK